MKYGIPKNFNLVLHLTLHPVTPKPFRSPQTLVTVFSLVKN
jgi:hypothetical protein